MYTFKLVLFAVVALLAFSALADVTGKFNIVTKYKIEKTVNGKKVTETKRNPILYEKKNLKSDKTLTRMTNDFGSWSGGEFSCKKARVGSSYQVEGGRLYDNKDQSAAANQRAKQIINSHANDE